MISLPAINETVYPRFKHHFSETDLHTTYNPTHEELLYSTKVTKTDENKFFFLILLKTCQRLGYFISINLIPSDILDYVANKIDVSYDHFDFETYDKSMIKRYHLQLIRDFINIKSYG